MTFELVRGQTRAATRSPDTAAGGRASPHPTHAGAPDNRLRWRSTPSGSGRPSSSGATARCSWCATRRGTARTGSFPAVASIRARPWSRQVSARELREETGYDVEVDRLVLLCEAIDPNPGGRHIVNAVYAGTVRGGELSVGIDKALRDAGSGMPVDSLTATMLMYPYRSASSCGRSHRGERRGAGTRPRQHLARVA